MPLGQYIVGVGTTNNKFNDNIKYSNEQYEHMAHEFSLSKYLYSIMWNYELKVISFWLQLESQFSNTTQHIYFIHQMLASTLCANNL